MEILAEVKHGQECEVSCAHRWRAFCHRSLLVIHTNAQGWVGTEFLLLITEIGNVLGRSRAYLCVILK